MYGTMVPHDCTYTAKSLQKPCLAPLLGLDVSLRYCIFMIYKYPCLWPVVCKKPLLSQVARNAVHTVVLGFCGVNSKRITTYIFFLGWSSKRSSTPPTVSILGCYVMIFTMIGPDCNVKITRKIDMFDISTPYIPLPHCRSAKPHNLIPNILR